MIKSISALFIWLCMSLVGEAQDLFSAGEKKAFDQQKVDISDNTYRINTEHMAAFDSIYQDFIQTHSINDEGHFIANGSITDAPETKAYFKDYVSKGLVQKTLLVARRCQNCKGNGKVWINSNPENPLSLSKTEIDCKDCPPDGRIPTEVTYTLVCSPKAVPVLPEKPRIVRQKLLISSALAGDVASQVEYALQLEAGANWVIKDHRLSRDYFIKAAIQGDKQGLAGVTRNNEAHKNNSKDGEFGFILKLVNAKAEKSYSGKENYFVNAEELAVEVPAGMSYLSVREAEIIARVFYSYYLSKDLKFNHFSYDGALALLNPIKKQMEKLPLVTARSKVEYAIISYALSLKNESFGQERMTLLKQAAVSLDPSALAILGEVSALGLNGKKNLQAAAIFYSISTKLRRDGLIQTRLSMLESKYDQKTVKEMVDEFYKTMVGGYANINFIDAMLKIKSHHDDIAK